MNATRQCPVDVPNASTAPPTGKSATDDASGTAGDLPEAPKPRMRRVWVPTQEEISHETAQIRAAWSDRERRRRAARCLPWTAPEVSSRIGVT